VFAPGEALSQLVSHVIESTHLVLFA